MSIVWRQARPLTCRASRVPAASAGGRELPRTRCTAAPRAAPRGVTRWYLIGEPPRKAARGSLRVRAGPNWDEEEREPDDYVGRRYGDWADINRKEDASTYDKGRGGGVNRATEGSAGQPWRNDFNSTPPSQGKRLVGPKVMPDIERLDALEGNQLLPGSASGPQYGYYFGGIDTALRRLAVSLALTALTLNVSNALAVPAGLYWLWSPVALAARRNAPSRKYPFKGMWRAEVLGLRTAYREAAPLEEEEAFDLYFGLTGAQTSGRVLQLLIGDDSGARVELEVPFAPEHSDIRIGDIAHLVVVSDRPDMSRFRVVREAYIPEARVWVSEYPFSERSVFMYISDQLEAQRRRRGGY